MVDIAPSRPDILGRSPEIMLNVCNALDFSLALNERFVALPIEYSVDEVDKYSICSVSSLKKSFIRTQQKSPLKP